jgi:ABC-type nitrate/sulfonate/bicarbonate transport system substrate-binding protein
MRLRRLAVLAAIAVASVACNPGTASPTIGATSTSAASGPADSPDGSAGPSTDPASLGPIRVGVEAPGGEAYIPTQLTVKRLADAGYDIEIIQFEDPDVMPQALDAGEIHINTNSAGQILSAVDAGLDVSAIMGLTDPEFFMVAKKEFPTCESLDGARVAQQGTTGFGFASVVTWLERDCPGTQPQMLDIPGSENRAIALLEDQIDATSLHILRARQIQIARPGDFVLIEGFGSPPNVTSAWSYALNSWLDENPELYQAYIQTYMDIVEEIEADPQIAVAEGLATIPDVEEGLLTEIMIMWAEEGWWPAADGVSEEVFDATLAFYESFTDYEVELTYENVIRPPTE